MMRPSGRRKIQKRTKNREQNAQPRGRARLPLPRPLRRPILLAGPPFRGRLEGRAARGRTRRRRRRRGGAGTWARRDRTRRRRAILGCSSRRRDPGLWFLRKCLLLLCVCPEPGPTAGRQTTAGGRRRWPSGGLRGSQGRGGGGRAPRGT